VGVVALHHGQINGPIGMFSQIPQSPLGRVAALLRYASPYRGAWVAIALLTCASSGLALLTPWPVQILVDHVLGSVPMPPLLADVVGALPLSGSASGMIALVAAAGLGLFVLGEAVDGLLLHSWTRVGRRMVYDLAEEMFARLQRRSLVFHTRSSIGDLLSRVTGDSWGVYSLGDTLLLKPVQAVIMIALMIVVMARLDLWLTAVSVAVAPFMAGASYWLAPRIRTAARLRRQVETQLLAHVQQTLSGIPVVQAYNAEDREQARFRQFADAAIGAQKRSAIAGHLHHLGTGLITAAGTALILWMGMSRVLEGTQSLGVILLFLAYLGMLQAQMKVLAGLWAAVHTVSANADRISEVMDAPLDAPESPNAADIGRARGSIGFEGVRFEYETGRPVLDGVDLAVPAGSTVAIVGRSGAGKSTLANLVPRFFDPSAGRVLLDGVDLRDLGIASLRRQIAVVLQDAFLFPVTVAENIAFGSPHATRDQIEQAARAAGAHEFICALPHGYDTVLAERGSNLSGGERQRLSIARALVKDAPILILDEPTASLDMATEAGLLEALRRLMSKRTTLVIAHRLSTIRNADRIVVLDRGRIAESGTHDQLLELGGIYADMYVRQSGEERRTSRVQHSELGV
jgi:ATP-binding cassette, subfamily B, bacterial